MFSKCIVSKGTERKDSAESLAKFLLREIALRRPKGYFALLRMIRGIKSVYIISQKKVEG